MAVFSARTQVEHRVADRSSQRQLERAIQSHDSGDLAAAEAAYRKILSRSPYDAVTMARLGIVLAQLKRPDETREVLIQASRLAPGNPDVQEKTAQALMLVEQYAGGAGRTAETPAVRPDHFDAWVWAGLASQYLGKTGEAIDAGPGHPKFAPIHRRHFSISPWSIGRKNALATRGSTVHGR